MRLLKKVRSKTPKLYTKDQIEELVKSAAQEAVFEDRKWNGAYREQGDNGPAPNDPFSRLNYDPFDRSPLYANQQLLLDEEGLALREQVRKLKKDDGRFKKAISHLAGVIEYATNGWITVGGGQRGLVHDREIIPEQLFVAQDATVLKVRTDPHASGVVQNLQFYTIGQGVTWATPSEEITEWLEEFRQMNKMEMRERKMVREIFQEGEYFWVYFVDPDTGKCKIRKWRPKELTEIETHKEDVETRLAYRREIDFNDGSEEDQWYADILYETQLEEFGGQSSEHGLESAIYIQMSKYGDLDNLRGWPPMYSILRWFKYLEDFVVDRARLHHERAKVIWFQQRKGTASRKGTTGSSQLNPLLAPKGGSMWVEDDTVSYRAQSLDLSSGDAERDALLILYAISSGVNMPMHVWNQRSDQQVYASIRKADTPFSQAILANQKFLEEEWEERDKFVIRKAVEAGSLPEQVEIIKHDEDLIIRTLQKINEMVADGLSEGEIIEQAKDILAPGMKKMKIDTVEVPITRTFPDVVQEAPLDTAKVLLIHQKMGIVSDATLSTKVGYDWHEELLRKLQEAKQKAALSALETGEEEREKRRQGLPNQIDDWAMQKQAAKNGDPTGTPGGGRAPGAGAGQTTVSRDDLSAGGAANTNVTPRKTEGEVEAVASVSRTEEGEIAVGPPKDEEVDGARKKKRYEDDGGPERSGEETGGEDWVGTPAERGGTDFDD